MPDARPDECEKCGSGSYVKEKTRPGKYTSVIVRRRVCQNPKCNHRWRTIEVYGMYDPVAKEWDGIY